MAVMSQSQKELSPMLVNDTSGIDTSDIVPLAANPAISLPVSLLYNIPLCIVKGESDPSNTILVRFEQKVNGFPSMLLTLAGMLMAVRLEQPLNAASSIVSSWLPDAKVTLVS